MRVRNRRTGRWIELPDDDGMTQAPGGHIISYEYRQQISEVYIGCHDDLPVEVRWASNQWGSSWLNATPRDRKKRQLLVPMLKTDITLADFRVISVEDELSDLLGL